MSEYEIPSKTYVLIVCFPADDSSRKEVMGS